MLFKDIPGHSGIKKQLISSLQENRISHALLFAGPEGCGTLPLAIAYAQYIACKNRSGEDSCGTCPSCIKMQKLVHPDLYFSLPVNQEGSTDSLHTKPFLNNWREMFLKNPWLGQDDWVESLDIGNKQPFISAYEAHEIIKALQYKPVESEYKFMIIWLPEKMRTEAANRLLKTLEEPSEKTLIILVSHDYNSLLKTILSRTQLIKVNRLSIDDSAAILHRITGAGINTCRLSAEIEEGNIVKARWLIQNSEEADAQLDLFRSWMQACYGFIVPEMLRITDLFAKESREWQKGFFAYSLYIIRQTMLMNHRDDLVHSTPNEEAFINRFRKFFNPGNYSLISQYINDASYHAERNAHGKILFFDLSLLIADVFRKEKERQVAH